jgi:hypothetical protein
MRIVELILEDEDMGVEAISIVSSPAIEEDFIALKKQEFKFAEQDKEKKLLVGAALVPNRPIFRKKEDEEYYIFFSKETVRKASQMFFKKGNQSKATLEHDVKLDGMTVVESWIVESEKDKSRHYGLDVPVGTWMVSMKVESEQVWNDYVKDGKVKGFSIEAFFSDRMERPKDKTLNDLSTIEDEEAENIVDIIKSILSSEKLDLETKVVSDNYAIIDDRLAYATEEKAADMAQKIGCEGYHIHNLEGKDWYMPCETHELKAPCTAGYEQYGMKRKGGKLVPNCIPIK